MCNIKARKLLSVGDVAVCAKSMNIEYFKRGVRPCKSYSDDDYISNAGLRGPPTGSPAGPLVTEPCNPGYGIHLQSQMATDGRQLATSFYVAC